MQDVTHVDERALQEVISFGPFRLFVAERRLERDGIAVRLSATALDILIFLIEHASEVVDEKDLIARVWPDRMVQERMLQERNVRPHMASLRKALGDGRTDAQYVTKVSGYRFVAPMLRSSAPWSAVASLPGISVGQPVHKFLNPEVGRTARSSRALDKKRLQRVLEFVEANLETDIGVEDLASVAALSPFHFSRSFRHATGKTPHRFVIERRIEKAKDLLVTGQATLAEIALICNFSSQASFTKAFTRAVGLPPGQYRHTARLKKNDRGLPAIDRVAL